MRIRASFLTTPRRAFDALHAQSCEQEFDKRARKQFVPAIAAGWRDAGDHRVLASQKEDCDAATQPNAAGRPRGFLPSEIERLPREDEEHLQHIDQLQQQIIAKHYDINLQKWHDMIIDPFAH